MLWLDAHAGKPCPLPFTVNLGGVEEKKTVASKEKAARYVSQRLNYHMKAALGRSVDYWFRLEQSDGENPYLHLHGELECSDAEIPLVVEALQKAGGGWTSKRWQVDLKARFLDTGWLGYVFKPDPVQLREQRLRRSGVTCPLSWRDGRFFIAQELSRRTREYYEALRKVVSVRTKPLRRRVKGAKSTCAGGMAFSGLAEPTECVE